MRGFFRHAIGAMFAALLAAGLAACGGGGGGGATTANDSPLPPIPLLAENAECAPEPEWGGPRINLQQQWPCRVEFRAILEAKVTRGEVVLRPGEVFVLEGDEQENPTHKLRVLAELNRLGSGAPAMTIEGTVTRQYEKIDFAANIRTIINSSMARCPFGEPSSLTVNRVIIFAAIGNDGLDNPSGFGCGLLRMDYTDTGQHILVGTFSRPPRTMLDPVLGFIDVPGTTVTIRRTDACGWAATHCIFAHNHGLQRGVLRSSFSAPQVAAAAQLLSTMWPDISVKNLVELLLNMAEDLGESGTDQVFGRGALSFRKLFSRQGVIVGNDPLRQGYIVDGYRYHCNIAAVECAVESVMGLRQKQESGRVDLRDSFSYNRAWSKN